MILLKKRIFLLFVISFKEVHLLKIKYLGSNARAVGKFHLFF